jgi:hypothetical protein
MITTKLSDHAALRLAQRAIRTHDLELAVLIGTQVEGGFLVLERESAAVARDLARLAERVRRLAGIRVVQDGENTVTAYRATREKRRRLLRHAEDRNMEV